MSLHTPESFAALLRDGDLPDIQAAFDAVYEQREALLRSLRRMVEVFEGVGETTSTVCIAARAAIAKATGSEA